MSDMADKLRSVPEHAPAQASLSLYLSAVAQMRCRPRCLLLALRSSQRTFPSELPIYSCRLSRPSAQRKSTPHLYPPRSFSTTWAATLRALTACAMDEAHLNSRSVVSSVSCSILYLGGCLLLQPFNYRLDLILQVLSYAFPPSTFPSPQASSSRNDPCSLPRRPNKVDLTLHIDIYPQPKRKNKHKTKAEANALDRHSSHTPSAHATPA